MIHIRSITWDSNHSLSGTGWEHVSNNTAKETSAPKDAKMATLRSQGTNENAICPWKKICRAAENAASRTRSYYSKKIHATKMTANGSYIFTSKN
jgi:hypothetical protein